MYKLLTVKSYLAGHCHNGLEWQIIINTTYQNGMKVKRTAVLKYFILCNQYDTIYLYYFELFFFFF